MKTTLRNYSRISTYGVLALLLSSGPAGGQSFSVTNISVPGAASLSVSALNGNGQVAGYFFTPASEQRAFFWADGAGLDLGTLGGSLSVANSLNNFSQVAGYSTSIGDTEFHAFVGIGHTLFDLGTLGGTVSTASSISDAGHITGYSFVSGGSVDAHAFLVPSGGTMRDLGTLGGSSSSGTAVNNAGQVVGDSSTAGDTETHAFLYSGGSLRDLGTLGGLYSSASGLNDAGQVTGESSIAQEAEFHAFLFDGTVLRDLRTLGGTYSTGYQINNSGQVIGDSKTSEDREYHGFFYHNGVMSDLGTLGGGFSSAWALNNSGQVVGVSSNSAGQARAVLWQNGVLSDLNSMLPAGSGWELVAAYFINDAGQIAGLGRWQGQDAWYVLTPRNSVNQPPLANAGADQTVDCAAAVTLDGRGSSDPDGDELRYAWYEGGNLLGTGATLTPSLGLGSHTITLRVTDSHDASADDVVVVEVRDTLAPVVRCPEGQSAPAGEGGAPVPDLLAGWVVSDNCTPTAELRLTQQPAAGTLVGFGRHEVQLVATDLAGNSTRCVVIFQVVDSTPPCILSLTADPSDLSPVNRQMVQVTVTAVVKDNADPNPRCRIVSVKSNEPDTGQSDHTTPDWVITGDMTVQLRAEVAKEGVRQYTICVACTDQAGNTSNRKVCVRAARGKD